MNKPVDVTFTATDNLSGVAATNFAVDGGTPQSGSSVTIGAEGSHTVSFWSVGYPRLSSQPGGGVV